MIVNKQNKFKDHKMKNSKVPCRIEWILVIASIILLSACYLYTDLPYTSSGGLRVWNCIAEGTPQLFYWSSYPGVEHSALPYGSEGGSYDFLIYLIFAIYNFPLWIWEKITGYSFIMFYATRLYTKGIILIFSGISAYMIYRIARECKVEKNNAIWAPLIFLTSGIFFATEVTIGGYDIISVAFTLIGIYGYLKDNKASFLGSFAVAIATKLFALWIFIPLLLLKEKKIWKLIAKTVIVLSAVIVPKLYFALASKAYFASQAERVREELGEAASDVVAATATQAYTYMPDAVNDVVAHASVINEALFPSDYTASYTFLSVANFPLIFAVMFSVWIFCFLRKKQTGNREVIYLCALIMGTFMATAKIHPYWGILLVPYLSLILVFRPEKIRENLFLETLMSVGFVMNKAILYYWCFGMSQIERMVNPNYQFSYDPETTNIGKYGIERIFYKLSQKIEIDEVNMAHMFSVLFVVAFVAFLYCNRPEKNEESSIELGDTENFRLRMMWRFAFSLFVGILPMIGLLMYVSPFYWGD